MNMDDTPRPAYVQFEVRAVEDRTKSLGEGRYASKDVIFAIVTPAGSRDRLEKEAEAWIAGVEEGVKQERIPETWLHAYRDVLKRFKESRENPEFGTPVRDWPALSPAQVKMLLNANIRSVEDVAEMNEEMMSRIGMGAVALKTKAKAWLDSAKDTGRVAAESETLRAENDALKARNAELEERLSRLETTMASLKSPNEQPHEEQVGDEEE